MGAHFRRGGGVSRGVAAHASLRTPRIRARVSGVRRISVELRHRRLSAVRCVWRVLRDGPQFRAACRNGARRLRENAHAVREFPFGAHVERGRWLVDCRQPHELWPYAGFESVGAHLLRHSHGAVRGRVFRHGEPHWAVRASRSGAAQDFRFGRRDQARRRDAARLAALRCYGSGAPCRARGGLFLGRGEGRHGHANRKRHGPAGNRPRTCGKIGLFHRWRAV